MLYSETDRTQVTQMRGKRRLVVLVPTLILLLVAVASFIWFRLQRNTNGWIWTALITVLGGAFFIFFYEVYLRPVSLYKRHVDYMLDGRKRDITGYLTHIEESPQDKDGMDCFAITVNIGHTNNPEDDRLFYYDALKGKPDVAIGTAVHVLSNDRMVASLERVTEETREWNSNKPQS